MPARRRPPKSPAFAEFSAYVENHPADLVCWREGPIRNDEGGWVGTSTEYVADGDRETVNLVGDGAYAGLTAYVVVDWGQPTRPFEGIIFPGEMPELPPAE